MKIIAVVAARGGSKSIPRKNLKKLNGKSLINYILGTLLNIKEIDRTILSSDSKEILRVAQKNNKKTLETRLRPESLSRDETPLTSVAHYVANELFKENYEPDVVLQVAPTCPFIKPSTIKKIIKVFKLKQSNCAVTLKRIEHEHPYRAKKLYNNNIFKQFIKKINLEKYLSRQSLPTLYCTSGAIYARTYKLLKSFSGKDFCLGKRPMGIVVDDIEAINIDRKIDLEFANYIASKKLFKKYKSHEI